MGKDGMKYELLESERPKKRNVKVTFVPPKPKVKRPSRIKKFLKEYFPL